MKPVPNAVISLPQDDWENYSPEKQRAELVKCALSPSYFINTYVKIFDPITKEWIAFELWPFQEECLGLIRNSSEFLGLKSRQVGFTWLALAYGLWLMLFRKIAEVLLFSKREDEAIYLLGEERLRGMYHHLPEWMKSRAILVDGKKHFRLSNGSGARAFPSNAGDSYTATYAVIDEADLLVGDGLSKLLGRVAPTVAAGGQLVLISRPDKSQPDSYFKQLYKDAKAGKNTWTAVFVPWHAHPGRDQAWYEKQKANNRIDDLHEQYPATDAEALSARSTDKLMESAWVEQCYVEMDPLTLDDDERMMDAPSISDLCVYRPPEPGSNYVIGVDPAEGKETSHDSSISVVDELTGEEVCHLSGKIHYTVLSFYIDQIASWYNDAQVMVERNNHGAAVLQWLEEHSQATLLDGLDENVGWQSNVRSKGILYSEASDTLKGKGAIIHSPKTYFQILSIERATMKAPSGMPDDASDSFVFALAARTRTVSSPMIYTAKVDGY